MGVLAPLLCLVRTFRAELHSALRSKGPKYDIRALGISPFGPALPASVSSAAVSSAALFCSLLQHAAALPTHSLLIIIIFLLKENIL